MPDEALSSIFDGVPWAGVAVGAVAGKSTPQPTATNASAASRDSLGIRSSTISSVRPNWTNRPPLHTATQPIAKHQHAAVAKRAFAHHSSLDARQYSV